MANKGKSKASDDELLKAIRESKAAADGPASEGPRKTKGLPPLDGSKAAAKDDDGKPGALRSLWEGARQGFTMGFSDEGSGLVHALMTKALPVADGVDPSFKEDFVDSYRGARDQDRATDAAAKEAHPWLHGAGEVGGNVVTGIATGSLAAKAAPAAAAKLASLAAGNPILNSAIRGAVSGAAQGTVQGLGGSNAEGYVENLADAGLGGVVGAVGGGALGALGKAAGPAIVSKLQDWGKGADRLRVLTAMGATGGSIARPRVIKEVEAVPGGVKEAARVMREHGMTSKIGKTASLLENADKANREANDVIGRIIEDVDDAGVPISAKGFADRLEAEAAGLLRNPEKDALAQALRDRAAQYRQRFPDDAQMTMREAQDVVSSLGKTVNWTNAANGQVLPAAKEGAAMATRAMREQMDNAAEAAFAGKPLPELVGTAKQVFPKGPPQTALEAYKQARRVSQVSNIVKDNAEESVARAAKRNVVSLSDGPAMEIAGAAAGAVLGPQAVAAGKVAGFLARHGIAPRSAAARATLAEMAQKLGVSLDNDGSRESMNKTAAFLAAATKAGLIRRVKDGENEQ